MRRDENLSGKLDWITVLLFIALTVLGWFNIFASVYDDTIKQNIWDLSLSSGRQLMFIVASLIIILGIIIIDM